jgi:putative tricarboxylic transport membrane protein
MFGVGVVLAALQLPNIPGVRFGADLMPLICGAALIILGILIATSKQERGEPYWSLVEWSVPKHKILAAGWSFFGLIAGIYLFEPLGFPIFGAIYMAGLMVIMKASIATTAIITPVFILLMHYVFTRMMFVNLPAGVFEGIL